MDGGMKEGWRKGLTIGRRNGRRNYGWVGGG